MRYKGDREFSRKNAAKAYKAMLEANRGHNYQYYTDELGNYLDQKGYMEYRENEREFSEHKAKEIVSTLRSTGHFARIICFGNKLRIKEFHIYYKLRKS